MRNSSQLALSVLASLAVSLLTIGSSAYAATTAAQVTCKDGTTSKGGKGACAHHGGIQKSGDAAATDAAAPAATTATHKASSSASSTAAASTGSTSAKPKSSTHSTSSGASTKSASASSDKPTAKCKDGTMSHAKNHTGACSKHGGVDQWLDQ